MLILQYKVPFTYDRLGPCLRFVYICACIAVFLCCYCFLVNIDLYIIRAQRRCGFMSNYFDHLLYKGKFAVYAIRAGIGIRILFHAVSCKAQI